MDEKILCILKEFSIKLFSALFLQEQFDVFIYPFALLLVIVGIILVNRKTARE